jgi:hypothetical protein
MIKCDLILCAVISKSASVKDAKDGGSFITFGVRYPVIGRKDGMKDMEISVSTDGSKSDLPFYALGRRVTIKGTLTIKKRDGKCYYNLRTTEGVKLAKSTDADALEGTMEFRGKIGKKGVLVQQDKNGKEYKIFSAFSVDKANDKSEFTWCRFLYFEPKDGEDLFAADKFVTVHGDLQLDVYNNEITLSCRVSDVEPWVMERGR